MKPYLEGIFSAIVLAGLLLILNAQLYAFTMPFIVLIPFLLAHAVVYTYMRNKQISWFSYGVFALIFLGVIFLSLPDVTYQEARETVLGETGGMIETEARYPLEGVQWFDVFSPTSAYLFTLKDGSEWVVMPTTGELLEIK